MGQTERLRILLDTQVDLCVSQRQIRILDLFPHHCGRVHMIEAHLDHVVEIKRIQRPVEVLEEWVLPFGGH